MPGHRQCCFRQRVSLAQPIEYVQPVSVGQGNVEQNQVSRARCGYFDCLRDSPRDIDVITRFPKKDAEGIRDEWTVFNDQNARRHYSRGTLSGSVKKKRLPLPNWLSTQILPWCNSTMRRAIARPSPVP